MKFLRARHDKSMPAYKRPAWTAPGNASEDWFPETRQLKKGPASGDGRFAYTKLWAAFLRLLNPKHYRWIERIAAGLFNRSSSPVPEKLADWDAENPPVAESISAGGNVFEILEELPAAYRVRMLRVTSQPPDAAEVNYQRTPWLISKGTSVHRGDNAVGLMGGLDVYWPNLSKEPGGLWLSRDQAEEFPALPIQVSVTAPDGINVREAPDLEAPVLEKWSWGTQRLVVEYAPRGSNVWGKVALSDDPSQYGWIALAYTIPGNTTPNATRYFTTWQMETDPPIVLKAPSVKPAAPPPQDPPAPEPVRWPALLARLFRAFRAWRSR